MKTFAELIKDTKPRAPEVIQEATITRETIPGLDVEPIESTLTEKVTIKPKPIKDSEDAFGYIESIVDHIDTALAYINEPSFFKYCTTTDKNFDVDTFPAVQKLLASLKSAQKDAGALVVQMGKAE